MYNNSFYCHISRVKVPSSDVSITQTSLYFVKGLPARIDRMGAWQKFIYKDRQTFTKSAHKSN